MKKMILSTLMILSSANYAEQLTTFSEMADAVTQGKKITLVMSIQECSMPKMPSTSIIGSVQPNAFIVLDNNRITTSVKHFTLDNPLSRGKPTFEYLKYNINADGTVSIKSTVMDATNYQKIATHQIDCTLNKGFKVFG